MFIWNRSQHSEKNKIFCKSFGKFFNTIGIKYLKSVGGYISDSKPRLYIINDS